MNLVARPLAALLAYAVETARRPPEERALVVANEKLLERDDEVGQLARLILYMSRTRPPSDPGGASGSGNGALGSVSVGARGVRGRADSAS